MEEPCPEQLLHHDWEATDAVQIDLRNNNQGDDQPCLSYLHLISLVGHISSL